MLNAYRVVLDPALIEELMPCITRNWAETGGCAGLDLDIDWTMYLQAQDMGVLYMFVLYDDFKVAGLLSYVRAPCHPHDQKVQYAVQDTFYVDPDYRKRGAAMHLMRIAERDLKEDGVGIVTQAAKPGSSFNKVLLARDYEHTENMYLKRL